MNRKIYFILSIGFVCALSGFAGYKAANIHVKKNKPEINEQAIKTVISENKITESTKMVYEYFYPSEGTTKTSEESPPYFLIGLSLDDMKRLYSTWDILSFSPSEVKMRKIMPGKDEQKYIIGEKDGLVTVFYDDEAERAIKEITSIDISSFGEDEKQQICEGISISGDDELNRALENLSS